MARLAGDQLSHQPGARLRAQRHVTWADIAQAAFETTRTSAYKIKDNLVLRLEVAPFAMYLLSVGEQVSLVNILSNYACGVYQRGPEKLLCRCGGLVMTVYMAISAIISGLAAISLLLLVRAGGDALMGLLGGIMGVTLATIFGHLAVQRYRRHGSFELDGERGVVRRYRVGRKVREFAFDEVHKVSLVLDPTDGIRLSGPPSWLQIRLESGEIFRLAKGSYKELAPVCAALTRLGLVSRSLARQSQPPRHA